MILSMLMYAGIGALIGAAACLLLYCLGGVIEFLSCVWFFVSCNFLSSSRSNVFDMWSTSAFINWLKVLVICGAVVGAVVGLCIGWKERHDEKASNRSQRLEQTNKVWEDAAALKETFAQDTAKAQPLVCIEYRAEEEMKAITQELARAARLQGELDAIVAEYVKGEYGE